MMREANDTSNPMLNSSIAILQARFRELERAKEKRQERELHKLFSSESLDRINSPVKNTMQLDSTKLSLSQSNDNIIPNRSPPPPPPPPKSHLQDSLLALEVNSEAAKFSDFRALKTSTNLWPYNHGSSSSSRNFDNTDIDTSLHL